MSKFELLDALNGVPAKKRIAELMNSHRAHTVLWETIEEELRERIKELEGEVVYLKRTIMEQEQLRMNEEAENQRLQERIKELERERNSPWALVVDMMKAELEGMEAENARLREALEWAIDKLEAAYEDGFNHIDADGNEVTDLDMMRAALARTPKED